MNEIERLPHNRFLQLNLKMHFSVLVGLQVFRIRSITVERDVQRNRIRQFCFTPQCKLSDQGSRCLAFRQDLHFRAFREDTVFPARGSNEAVIFLSNDPVRRHVIRPGANQFYIALRHHKMVADGAAVKRPALEDIAIQRRSFPKRYFFTNGDFTFQPDFRSIIGGAFVIAKRNRIFLRLLWHWFRFHLDIWVEKFIDRFLNSVDCQRLGFHLSWFHGLSFFQSSFLGRRFFRQCFILSSFLGRRFL